MYKTKVLLSGIFLISFFLIHQPALAALEIEQNKNAAYDKHYPEILYPTLRKAIDLGQVFIIDANNPDTYSKGHLPLARTINDTENLKPQLPVIKSYPVVVYCGGPQCSAWHKAADYAAAQGYSNVLHYKGGLQDWKNKGDTLVTGNSY